MESIPTPFKWKYEKEGPKLNPDEPWFLIRAQDALSIKAIEAYQQLCEDNGLMENAMEIAAIVGSFKRWQRNNLNIVRLPRTAPSCPGDHGG